MAWEQHAILASRPKNNVETMKNLKQLALFLTLSLTAFTLSSCGTADGLKVGLNGLLLEAEFEQVRETFRDEDLTIEERLAFEESVTVFEEVRIELKQLSEGKVNPSLLIKVATADKMLERLRLAFTSGEKVVINYYARNNQPIPIQFTAYKTSAAIVYNELRSQTVKQNDIPWQDIQSLVMLAVRSYAAINVGAL